MIYLNTYRNTDRICFQGILRNILLAVSLRGRRWLRRWLCVSRTRRILILILIWWSWSRTGRPWLRSARGWLFRVWGALLTIGRQQWSEISWFWNRSRRGLFITARWGRRLGSSGRFCAFVILASIWCGSVIIASIRWGSATATIPRRMGYSGNGRSWKQRSHAKVELSNQEMLKTGQKLHQIKALDLQFHISSIK